MKHPIRSILASACAALGLVAGSASAQMADWEAKLYEAAKKEKEFTVYTSHYNTEDAAALCSAFEQKYPGVKCQTLT